jgi:hypothetical protein
MTNVQTSLSLISVFSFAAILFGVAILGARGGCQVSAANPPPPVVAVFEGEEWSVETMHASFTLDRTRPATAPPEGPAWGDLPRGTWCGSWTEELSDDDRLRRDHVLVFGDGWLRGLLLDSVDDLDFGRIGHLNRVHLDDQGRLCAVGVDLEGEDPQDLRALQDRLGPRRVDRKLGDVAIGRFPTDGRTRCWPTGGTPDRLVLGLAGEPVAYDRCDPTE